MGKITFSNDAKIALGVWLKYNNIEWGTVEKVLSNVCKEECTVEYSGNTKVFTMNNVTFKVEWRRSYCNPSIEIAFDDKRIVFEVYRCGQIKISHIYEKRYHYYVKDNRVWKISRFIHSRDVDSLNILDSTYQSSILGVEYCPNVRFSVQLNIKMNSNYDEGEAFIEKQRIIYRIIQKIISYLRKMSMQMDSKLINYIH